MTPRRRCHQAEVHEMLLCSTWLPVLAKHLPSKEGSWVYRGGARVMMSSSSPPARLAHTLAVEFSPQSTESNVPLSIIALNLSSPKVPISITSIVSPGMERHMKWGAVRCAFLIPLLTELRYTTAPVPESYTITHRICTEITYILSLCTHQEETLHASDL